MKKIILILLLIFISFTLSCKESNEDKNNEEVIRKINYDFSYLYHIDDSFTFDKEEYIIDENHIKLPDLTDCSIGEVKYILDSLGALYNIEFDHSNIRKEEDYNKFVSYSHDLKEGDIISLDKFFYAYVTELPLTYSNVSEVTLDIDEYYDKSFIEDGIGVVTLLRCVDGDTAWFIDNKTGEELKLRFYAIDTPESTIDHDPWGKEASNYTKNILTNANLIVLEREDGHIKDTYGRYLGYVWCDGVLLNLDLVSKGYTNAASSGSKYQVYFTESMLHCMKTGRRIYGELDPGYDYNLKDFK